MGPGIILLLGLLLPVTAVPLESIQTCPVANTHQAAVSADGRYRISSGKLRSLQIVDAVSGKLIKQLAVINRRGETSRVSAVYTAPVLESFLVTLMDLPEIWQISYADEPPPGFGGWVHDYRVDSGENYRQGKFPVRRIRLDTPLQDVFVDPDGVFIVGVSSKGNSVVVDLDLGRQIVNRLEAAARPHPGIATTWEYQGDTVLALADFEAGIVSIFNTGNWKLIKHIETSEVVCSFHAEANSPVVRLQTPTGKVEALDKSTLILLPQP